MTNVDNDLISLQLEKEISNLFKYFLETLEDLKNSQKITEEQFNVFRKKTLDKGNDCERNILQFINYFDFQINKEKVQEATSKRITKRFCTNSVLSV